MANEIKLKRGSGSDPGASDLVVGEIAIRTDTGKLFTKKDNGSVAEISGSGGIDDGDKGDITVSNGGDTFTIDNGVVTSAKIADGTIVNADISGSAAIDGSKLQAAGLVNAGSMSAANFNKLAGIEANATADMTGTEILATISGENIILGEIASTGNSTFAGNITLSSSDGGSAAAPELDLYRISASPADADYLGQIKFSGEDAADNKQVYAKITGKAGDVTNATEDGILEFMLTKAGSNNIAARFTSTDLKLINGTGLEVAGNISCDGTIDGRDVASDGTKLDGIESGATADQTAAEIRTLVGSASDSNVFTDALLSKLNGIAASATNVTNNNQLTNGAGYITATLTNEQVQDIVGGMVSGNTESGITVTYQDGDGTIDFAVASQTDQNFTNADHSKLDGIEAGATADQTASEILTLIKTVDGAGSGLDADTLDGYSQGNFVRTDGTHTCSGKITFSDGIVLPTTGDGIKFGAGDAANDDAHIEWLGGSNAGYLRISTSDDSDSDSFANEYIEIGDYENVNKGGTFTQHLRISRDRFLVRTGTASSVGDRLNIASDGTVDIYGNLDVGAGLDLTGNMTVTGTVDGRDVASDGSKLDGIESGATADQSNSEIKTAYEANSNTNAFTDALLSKLNGIAASATNVTNNNQLTNGAGYITATLTNEQVQDIVGGMVSGNTESGITVTYQDGDGTIDFSVASQTDNNFTNADHSKLDGIESGATADQTASEIRALVESASDSNVFTDADHSKLNGIAAGATNVTNTNQLTNGAGFITATLTNEQVQDIVGGMVSGNTESGITVTYQDGDGTLDFSVASQTDNNFTNADHSKLDGIAAGATNVTNNNQISNGAGYVTSSVINSLNASNLSSGTIPDARFPSTLPAVDGSNLTGISAGATGGGSDEVFYENDQTVTTNYTITNGKNAMAAGPITINSGVTVTVGSGETLTIV